MKKSLIGQILKILIVMVIPLNILSMIAAFTSITSQRDIYQKNIENITNIYARDIDAAMSKADLYLFNTLTGDADGITMQMCQTDEDFVNAKYRVYLDFQTELNNDRILDGYYLSVKDKGSLFETARDRSENEKALLRQCFEEDEKLHYSWNLVTLEENDYLVLYNSNKGVRYGAYINLEKIYKEILQGMPLDNTHIRCVTTPAAEKGLIRTASALSHMDASLEVTFPRWELFHRMSIWTKFLVLFSFVALLVIPLMYNLLHKLIIEPLMVLNNAHHEMKIGHKDYKIQENAQTVEFETAYQSFNTMMDSMELLRLENMQKELEKKKLEVRNLQLQIRPHFLLNSFNLVYMFSRQGNMEAIQKLILYLSDYFRYIFRSGKELELFGKELHLIEGYIEAAKMRYPDRVSIMYEIDPEIEMVRVPPLLIHNFIENVIVHAMNPDESIHIVLAAEYEEKEVRFIISDDGKGMDEEHVRRINNKEWFDEEENRHLGIKNAVQRLQTFYGEEAYLHVRSAPGKGTEMTIHIPYDLDYEEA